MEISDLLPQLQERFTEYQFSMGKRVYGKTIIAFKSKYVGADIFYQRGKLVVLAAVPKMSTRILIGAGAVLVKMFKSDYSEPAEKIAAYFRSINIENELRK